MNVVFVYDDYLVTPRLNGSILPGVTRDSILTLAKERGLAVKQRRYSIDEWRADAASGVLREVFACGTAAVITPIASVRSAHGDFTIGDGGFGPVSASLRQELVDIQRGRIPDRHGWVRRVWDPPAAASVPERIDRARRSHRPATAARSAAPTVRAGRRGTGYPVAGRISSA
jgi:branched-chain amino acid aminotransferase